MKAPRSIQSCCNKGNTRFAIVDDKDVGAAAKGVIPANTAKNNACAARNFSGWVDSRNKSCNPDDRIPDELLSCSDPVVCSWLCRIVLETRQKSGEPYPPKSIYFLWLVYSFYNNQLVLNLCINFYLYCYFVTISELFIYVTRHLLY